MKFSILFLLMISAASVYAQPVNDSFAGAVPIVPADRNTASPQFTLPFSSDGTTASGMAVSCTSNPGNDQFFSWTADAQGLYFNSHLPGRPGVSVYDTAGNEIDCIRTQNSDKQLHGWNIGDNLIIRIYVVVSNTSDVAFDLERVTCLRPENFTIGTLSSTTADFSWNNISGASNAVIEVGVLGFTPGSGTTYSASGNSGTATGLTPNADYEAYVYQACGGSTSRPLGPISFTTDCTTYTALPFYEDVESGDRQLDCWSITDADTDGNSWQISSGASVSRSGQRAWGYFPSPSQLNNDLLISPQIRLNGNQRLRYYDSAEISIHPTSYEVLVSTTGDNVQDFNQQLRPLTSTSNENYEERIIDLTAFSGDIYIAFRIPNGNVGGQQLLIDDIYIENIPSCIAPTDFTLTAMGSDFASFDWVNSSGNNQAVLEYGAPGFTIGSGIRIKVTGSNHDLTGLTELTDYEIYIQQECSSTDLSRYIGPLSFTTPCTSVVAPYFEDFESFASTQQLTEDNCWTDYGQNSFTWAVADITTPSSNTGPISAFSGSQYLFSEASSGVQTDTAVVLSPSIDLNNLNEPVLTFQYYMFGADMTSLEVAVSDDNWATFTVLGSIDGEQQTAGDHEWRFAYYDLSRFLGSNVMFKFSQVKGSGTNADIAIDNFRIDEAPSCPNPAFIEVDAEASRSAVISYQANHQNTSVLIEYGPEGFTRGTGTITASPSSPFSITGLDVSTAYDLYLTADCGSELSAAEGPITFETTCGSLTTGYSEDFTEFRPICWDMAFGRVRSNGITINNGISDWEHGTYANGGISPSAFMQLDQAVNGDWVITPSISLTGQEQITFDIALTSGFTTANPNAGGADQEFMILISQDDGATWSSADVLRKYDNAGSVHILNSLDAAGETVTLDLSAYSGITARIGFYAATATSTSGNLLHLDNFRIEQVSTCAKPTSILFSNETNTSVDVAYSSTGTTGDVTIEYGPDGFNPGTGTILTSSLGTITINGLQPSRDYDLYIKRNCGPNDSSVVVGPIDFNTLCGTITAPYTMSFESTEAPSCWLQSGSAAWEFGSIFGTELPGFAMFDAQELKDHSSSGSGSFIGIDGDDNTDGQTSSIETPLIDISTLGIAEVSFWMFSSNTRDTASNILNVEVYDGTSWTNELTLQGDQGDAWRNYAIDLSSYTTSSPIKIRFSVTGAGNGGQTRFNDILLDDIQVQSAAFRYDNGWNRNPEGVSTASDDVYIIDGTATLIGPVTARHIFVESDSSLDLAGGDVSLSGDLVNDGRIQGGSSVTLDGSDRQLISSSSQSTIENLTVNNASGASIVGDVIITGILTVNQGNLSSNGSLTLRSDALNTAIVAPMGKNANITGEVRTQLYIPGKRAYRFITSSVNSTGTIHDNWQNRGINDAGNGTHITGAGAQQSGFDTTGTNESSMYTYSNILQQWEAVIATNTGSLDAGTPYRLWVRGDRTYNMNVDHNTQTSAATVLSVTGNLQSGDVTTGSLGDTAGDFGMVGNPYMAPVDFQAVLANSTNVRSDVYYVWDPTSGANGAYTTYSFGTGTNSLMGSAVDGTLRSGQAVFVEVNGSGGSSIRFRESDKTLDTASRTVFSTEDAVRSMQIGLYPESNSNGVALDGTVLMQNGTFSAPKLMNPDENIFFKQTVSQYSILSYDDSAQKYDLAVTVGVGRTYTLVIASTLIDEGLYLLDRVTDERISLKEKRIKYTFTGTENSVFNSRFAIVKGSDALGTTNSIIGLYPNPAMDGDVNLSLSEVYGAVYASAMQMRETHIFGSTKWVTQMP